MKNKYVFVAVLLAVILFVGSAGTIAYVRSEEPAQTESEVTVVTSFYPMYIAVLNILGDSDAVSLENLSEPQTGCLHDYQLTAADMKLLSTADIFVVNGGGIESFLTDVASEYPDLTILYACEDLELEEDNAHAWMSMEDYMIQVQTIADGLAAADPARADTYQDNAAAYIAKVQALKSEYAKELAGLAGQPVILFHEAYEYVAEEFGLEVVGILDLDEERQVSAGEVADILTLIEEYDVPFILAEELYAKDMGDRMEEETSVTVLYLDTMTRGDYEADSYLTAMRSNLELLLSMVE